MEVLYTVNLYLLYVTGTNHLQRNIWENGESGLVLYSLQSIDNFSVSRMIVSTSISRACRLDVNGFLDASEYMIAEVAYL